MSLAIAAQHLAATGRGDDTELIHMSKPEVAGLMALAKQHGGNLTRNPQTGLIEAGFLSSILPMIAGLGLAAATGGTSLAMSPMMIGALVGGGTGLATGSLKKGLLAGLGAYGGADLFGGLAGAGASAAGDAALAAAPTAVSAAPVITETVAAPALTSAADATLANAAQTSAGGMNAGLANLPVSQQAIMPTSALDSSIAANANVLTAEQQAATARQALAGQQYATELAQVAPTQSQYALQGLKNLSTKGGFGTLTTQLGGPTEALKTAAMAAAPVFGQTQNVPGMSDLDRTIRPWKYTSTYANPAGMPGNAAAPFFNQQFVAQPTYLAGAPGHAGGGLAHGASRGTSLRNNTAMLHGVQSLMHYGQGGNISNLGGYSDGGQLLRGPGDGVSDSIPAQIGQHQPARLAEGEFVVPARIVSELGNGSTDAGAKKLYQMLNRIQAGRAKSMRGKNAYAKNTNADRHMPA